MLLAFAYAVSLFRQQFSSASVPTASTQAKACLFAFQPINATVLAIFWVGKKAPKPVTIYFPCRNKIHKNKSHASFLHEASYFGLMRQPYLVSLWQLDLERAETAVVLR